MLNKKKKPWATLSLVHPINCCVSGSMNSYAGSGHMNWPIRRFLHSVSYGIVLLGPGDGCARRTQCVSTTTNSSRGGQAGVMMASSKAYGLCEYIIYIQAKFRFLKRKRVDLITYDHYYFLN